MTVFPMSFFIDHLYPHVVMFKYKRKKKNHHNLYGLHEHKRLLVDEIVYIKKYELV